MEIKLNEQNIDIVYERGEWSRTALIYEEHMQQIFQTILPVILRAIMLRFTVDTDEIMSCMRKKELRQFPLSREAEAEVLFNIKSTITRLDMKYPFIESTVLTIVQGFGEKVLVEARTTMPSIKKYLCWFLARMVLKEIEAQKDEVLKYF